MLTSETAVDSSASVICRKDVATPRLAQLTRAFWPEFKYFNFSDLHLSYAGVIDELP